MYIHTKEKQERFSTALRQQLKAELAICDIPNDQVADSIKIHRATLYKYLRGASQMPVDTMYAFCRVVGVRPERFIERVIERMDELP